MIGAAREAAEGSSDLSILFNPRAVILAGASERSIWTKSIVDNLSRFGFPGAVHFVNRKGQTVFGRSAASSCTGVGEQADVAFVLAPANAVEDAIEDVGRAGVGFAIVLTAGFGENGEGGRVLQERISNIAKAGGVRLLGPNCLGFVNYSKSVPLWAMPMRRPRCVGGLAMVSHSGALAEELAQFAQSHAVALNSVISTGNEADIGAPEIIEHLVLDEGVSAVAFLAETIRDAPAFAAAATQASTHGKPIIVMKLGASETSARLAQSHTGALVGDDRVFDAVCDRYNLIRVHSLEDLVLTADMFSKLPPASGRGVAVAAFSGGACEVAADAASLNGLELPDLEPATIAALRAALPAFASPRNPLDMTGGVLASVDAFESSLAALGGDSTVETLALIIDAPSVDDKGGVRSQTFVRAGKVFAALGKRALVLSNTLSQVSDAGLAAVDAAHVAYSSAGIQNGVAALARWSKWRARPLPHAGVDQGDKPAISGRPCSEREVLDWLAGFGVPVIPAVICGSAAEAEAAAAMLGGRVALKISAAGVLHKSDIGGVLLDVDPDDAGAQWKNLFERVKRAAPDVVIDQVMVSPMRSTGLELIVGIVRDPQWGLVLNVGLGGVFVEVLRDARTALLPVTRQAVAAMLRELRGARLFEGVRGRPAVDLDAIAGIVTRIADAARSLGDDLQSLEVNPLWVSGEQVEALDALAEWRGAVSGEGP